MPIAVNTPKRASNPPSMDDLEFLRCPACGGKTRDKVRQDTELKNFPLFCPKCKCRSLIDVKDARIISVDTQNE